MDGGRQNDSADKQVDPQQSDYRFCTNCGSKIWREAILCPHCKASVSRVAPKKEKEKRKSKGIWKLIIGGVYIVWGLLHFGVETYSMVFALLIGGGLVLWWFAKNWERKTDE